MGHGLSAMPGHASSVFITVSILQRQHKPVAAKKRPMDGDTGAHTLTHRRSNTYQHRHTASASRSGAMPAGDAVASKQNKPGTADTAGPPGFRSDHQLHDFGAKELCSPFVLLLFPAGRRLSALRSTATLGHASRVAVPCCVWVDRVNAAAGVVVAAYRIAN
jgi:hypothetical protein